VGQTLDVVCQPVVFHPRQGFVPIQPEDMRSREESRVNSISSQLKRQIERWGLLDLARNWRLRFERYSSTIQSAFQGGSSSQLQFNSRDILLLLDSSWTTPYWDHVRQAQQAGAFIGAMVYDLLPIRFPDLMTSRQRDLFVKWWQEAYRCVDFITAISQSVNNEVREYDECHQTRGKRLLGGAFLLGADFLPGKGDGGVRHSLEALVNDGTSDRPYPFYICVGTFSPRKQQELVLKAFDKLWRRGNNVSLVYIGGSGWHSEGLIRYLQSHPRWGKSLHWFADLKDEELSWCYRHAAGLIAASIAEGFDLPIVEALHHGCPVLASDIPVHREVGQDFAGYFSPQCPDELARLLERQLTKGCLEKTTSPKDFIWPTWQKSCDELLRLVLRLSQQCKDEHGAGQRQSA
jgi:alpha-1,2-rhamnosyltransferase